MAVVSSVGAPIGSLNNHDGDVNKNSNKAIGLDSRGGTAIYGLYRYVPL